MWRLRGSTSVRLTAGFVAVMCLFGAALAVTLFNLRQVQKASEQTRLRQEIRRDALKIGRLAEQLFFCQDDFVEAADFDFDKVAEFQETYQEMEKTFAALARRPVDKMERSYLDEMMRQALRLRDIFYNRMYTMKIFVKDGVESPDTLLEIHRESRQVLERINELNDELGHSFELKVQDAGTQARRAWETSLTTTKAVLAVAFIASLLVILYTYHSIVSPVRKLIEGTKALAEGDLSRRVAPVGAGEFRELADSFNRMTEALAMNQRQLVESEKLAGIGRLAAGVAHEINNPIAVILGYAQMLRSSLPECAPSELREGLESIEEEARICKNIVQDLLDLARPSSGEGEVVNPAELVSEVLNLTQILQLTQGVAIETDVVDEPLPLPLSRARLRQLVLNLVLNALEELQTVQDARLTVKAHVSAPAQEGGRGGFPPGSAMTLAVTDNGPGIPQENLNRLFEPFFTTKSTGTGLGLAITYSIVKAHQGTIEVESQEGLGTTFTIRFPLMEELPSR